MTNGVPHCLRIATVPAIQPVGWTIVCDAQAARVTGFSANLPDLVRRESQAMLGSALRDLVGSETSHAMRNALSRAAAAPRPAFLPLRRIAGCEGLYDCAVHAVGEQTIIEFERASEPDILALDRARALVDRLAQVKEPERLPPLAARLVYSILQWDWVAVLRLTQDGGARLLTQQKRLDWADVEKSKQAFAEFSAEARNQWRAARLRFVADVESTPVEFVGSPAPNLAFAHLRAATADERARAAQAGFAALLTLPIVIEGELWGLLVAHDREARALTMDERAVFDLFGDFLSLSMQSALWRETAAGARRSHALWSSYPS